MHLVFIGSLHPSQQQAKMRALVGLLLLSLALSLLSSVSRAQPLGHCDPSKAVKIIDDALGKGKSLEAAGRADMKNAKTYFEWQAAETEKMNACETIKTGRSNERKTNWNKNQPARQRRKRRAILHHTRDSANVEGNIPDG